jgi:fucose 4-O-acetylase-like acetyltransferase
LTILYVLFNAHVIPSSWFVDNIVDPNNDNAFFRMYIPASCTVFVLSFTAMFWNISKHKKSNSIFNFLGSASVIFFLIHEFIINCFCKFTPIFPQDDAHYWCSLIVCYIIALSISLLFCYPLQKLINKINYLYSKQGNILDNN